MTQVPSTARAVEKHRPTAATRARLAETVMANPPPRVGCDHWNYLVGLYLDAAQTSIFVGVNSWTTSWGQGWGKAPGGMWLGGPAIIHAADCLIAYVVKEVLP